MQPKSSHILNLIKICLPIWTVEPYDKPDDKLANRFSQQRSIHQAYTFENTDLI